MFVVSSSVPWPEGMEGVEEERAWSRGEYFHTKTRKLREQFSRTAVDAAAVEEEAGGRSALSQGKALIALPIFKGVTVFLNGYTRPPRDELRELLVRHGGVFEQYPSSSVTHIVATAMPPSTINRLKAIDQVVKPDWITASVAAGALLPWRDFALLDWQKPSPSVAAMIGTKKRPSPSLAQHSSSAAGRQSPIKRQRVGDIAEATLAREEAILVSSSDEEECSAEGDHVQVAEGIDSSQILVESDAEHRDPPPHFEVSTAELEAMLLDVDEEQPPAGAVDAPPAAQPGPALGASAAEVERPPSMQPPEPPSNFSRLDLKCTDPQFIRRYFEASRLHHLSHWRTSIQEQLAGLIGSEQMAEQGRFLADESLERVIFHVDMDCFFASVSSMCHPEYEGKPVAVCHSASDKGTADVASVNYAAREHGMWPSPAAEEEAPLTWHAHRRPQRNVDQAGPPPLPRLGGGWLRVRPLRKSLQRDLQGLSGAFSCTPSLPLAHAHTTDSQRRSSKQSAVTKPSST